jgi:hypothetical protein
MPVKIRSTREATHYENLKVSEKAPFEVIKAAYRVLSMQWHPDKNPGDVRAARMMRLLNEAYEVLSDPPRRQEYDATLVRSHQASTASSSTPPRASAWKSRKSRTFSFAMVVRNIRRWNPRWLFAGAAVVLVAFSVVLLGPAGRRYLAKRAEANTSTSTSVTAEQPVAPEALPQRPAIDLRVTNPLDGHPWPKRAAYLPGFEKLATDGYSSVTVDNSKNTSDVFLKLVSAEYRQPSKVVRVCFIPARATFTFYRVTPGRYEMRYQEVEDGACLKTETFVLSQTKRLQGFECTQLRVPLYGLPGRSVNLLQSDEREFIAAAPTASR